MNQINISTLSLQELRDLNECVVSRIKAIRLQAEIKAASNMFVGADVSFTARGKLQMGKVTKVNPTTVMVMVGSVHWKVAANLVQLHQAKAAA